jgi:hypothetical protein
MWCAYLFVLIAIYGVPKHGDTNAWVQWTSQTFLQLTLLSVIMVGQDVQGKAAEQRAEEHMERIERLEKLILEKICVKEGIEI